MRELLQFDVRPRYEYATVNLGEVASFEIWFQMTNLSPFQVELDRAGVDFYCSGVCLTSSSLMRISLDSGETKQLHIRGTIPDGHANHIARNAGNHCSYIEGILEFNCDLHNFSKNNWHLNGVLPRFVNVSQRVSDPVLKVLKK
jgi:hypothetical protein